MLGRCEDDQMNSFAEMSPEQAFTLEISKPANPGADFHWVTNVVLAIEDEASLVSKESGSEENPADYCHPEANKAGLRKQLVSTCN